MIKYIHYSTFIFYANINLKHSTVLTSEKVEIRFIALYGLCPRMTSVLWYRLVSAAEKDSSLLPPNAQPYHLLWALLLMKCYNNEHLNAHITDVDEKTFRKWSWILIEAIEGLYDEMVRHCLLKFTYIIITLTFFYCFISYTDPLGQSVAN